MVQAGYACTAQWSARYWVTVLNGATRFIKPILDGQMLTLKAQILHTERTLRMYTSV